MAEKGTFLMSEKERDSFLVLERVNKGEISLVEASQVLSVSYRQICRRNVRYLSEGAAGLMHRLRGKPGNRAIDSETRERITEFYLELYDGFGPVLFSEKLLSVHGIKVDHETVRRVLVKAGLWKVTRKRKKLHRAWRERRSHFGDMVQIDGSHHPWFENRGGKCCLMVMIDDATGTRMSLMANGETTEAAMRLLWKWIDRYGVPRSLYADKKNVYISSEKDREKAKIEGREAVTQFGRACSRLGIEIIPAHSPQAKGRVERSNGVYQDRLVKELRLCGIADIGETNRLLETGGFNDDLNRKFAVEPKKKADYHRRKPEYDLATIFCIEEERTLSANWTLSFYSSLYRIEPASENYSPAKTKVQVRQYLDGSIHMFYRNREVEFEKFIPRQEKKKTDPSKRVVKKPHAAQRQSPAADHPWRRMAIPKRDTTRYF